MLDKFPADIILIIFQYLGIQSLAALAASCQDLYGLVEEYGWKSYAQRQALPHPSLFPALQSGRWTMRDLVKNEVLAGHSWNKRKYITRPLGPAWPTKYHPILAINDSYLAVGAGNAVFLYRFTPPFNGRGQSPGVVFDNMITFPRDARKDISGLFFEEDGQTLLVSFVHGALGRVAIPKRRSGSRQRHTAVKSSAIFYIREHGPPIRSLSVCRNTALTMSSLGIASLYALNSGYSSLLSETSSESVFTNPGWSGYLSIESGSGYAILGTSSRTPLVKHSILQSELSSEPDTILSPGLEDNAFPLTSVYAISGATKSYPSMLSSDQIVVSGWYHGSVTVHDLRTPPSYPENSGDLPSLRPVLKMEDPIKPTAVYSVSTAGPRIISGSAQHSVLQLFDVRASKSGWSIYLPQGRSASSPVYCCILESSRAWAATESHALVVDFGTVHERTYPPVGEREMDGKRRFGWHAPSYEHGMFR
ncbi:hypothetical protein M422DRAFT_215736 [Sphaerobolus stellatus SS14]|uniref:F-box domain-containing protein n=1 Tax=Sphaerobolus stellatus (strain SS14) TaxID=990650 RepID=A0A0C9U0U0_SPHS4|nr:hypothetical protein M422DRAFT_215736 [Sphaerobolus stellatus SS14]